MRATGGRSRSMRATSGEAEGAATVRDAPEPALTVAAVARRLGVAPATLRTWDRRYDLGPSAHTAGAHRRYTAADLARLTLMRRLTLQGVAPAEAAAIALASPADEAAPDTPARDASDAFLADVARLPAPVPPPADRPSRSTPGGGRVLAIPGGSPASRGLARAA